jgi:hypothetical protein
MALVGYNDPSNSARDCPAAEQWRAPYGISARLVEMSARPVAHLAAHAQATRPTHRAQIPALPRLYVERAASDGGASFTGRSTRSMKGPRSRHLFFFTVRLARRDRVSADPPESVHRPVTGAGGGRSSTARSSCRSFATEQGQLVARRPAPACHGRGRRHDERDPDHHDAGAVTETTCSILHLDLGPLTLNILGSADRSEPRLLGYHAIRAGQPARQPLWRRRESAQRSERSRGTPEPDPRLLR